MHRLHKLSWKNRYFTENYFYLIVFSCFLISIYMTAGCKTEADLEEIRLSNDDSKNFNLDNRYNFSPDDQWLVYDTRTNEGGIGGCGTIEKINVKSGETIVLYQTPHQTIYGPGVGAPSYSHIENKVIFIHGLMNCNADRPYEQWRRTGVIIDEKTPGIPIFMDARDVTVPYTAGALRGGTHDHEWSADGKWIGFTYNDAVMKSLEDKTGKRWNLRTIGVSKPLKAVTVDQDPDGENIDGTWYSVLIVKVVPEPRPGTDEINHAAGDCWIGDRGYLREDGRLQRARAFLGTVISSSGAEVSEVFVADLPEDITAAGKDGPLEGTESSFPMPPAGTKQRRLTFTAETANPGCLGILHCSADGRWIAYRAKDENGIDQVFFISPLGGDPMQVTHHDTGVQSDIHWNPDGKAIFYIQNNSVIKHTLGNGNNLGMIQRITQKSQKPPSNLVVSHNGRIVAINRDVTVSGNQQVSKQIFIVRLDQN
jgi:hypothetical protein